MFHETMAASLTLQFSSDDLFNTELTSINSQQIRYIIHTPPITSNPKEWIITTITHLTASHDKMLMTVFAMVEAHISEPCRVMVRERDVTPYRASLFGGKSFIAKDGMKYTWKLRSGDYTVRRHLSIPPYAVLTLYFEFMKLSSVDSRLPVAAFTSARSVCAELATLTIHATGLPMIEEIVGTLVFMRHTHALSKLASSNPAERERQSA